MTGRLSRLCAVLLLGAGLALAPALAPAASAGAAASDLTVLSRNLYLGADVAEALKLMPDVPAAAQFMWDQVQQTNFSARVPALAAEAVAASPGAIALQEATTWVCTVDPSRAPVTVFDFTRQFLDATAAAGTAYVLAESDGSIAFSPGYAIDPIVGATLVTDPARFQPMFGTDAASCGLRIADALLVRGDLAANVTAAGSVTYPTTTPVIPGFITVQRGYAWADLTVGTTSVRLVATHLESLWKSGEVPPAVVQSRELVADLTTHTGPLVVIGDFNNDPRDPRPAGTPNPGGQPEASPGCPDRSCNSYWSMIDAGFTDAGPDALDPVNFTWGASATLAGPAADRVQAGLTMGNPIGFTDRLDYVFTRGDITVDSARLVGDAWPIGPDTWTCSTESQILNTAQMESAIGAPTTVPPDTGVCFPTDHAGILATLLVSSTTGAASASTTAPGIGLWIFLAIVAVALVIGATLSAPRRR